MPRFQRQDLGKVAIAQRRLLCGACGAFAEQAVAALDSFSRGWEPVQRARLEVRRCEGVADFRFRSGLGHKPDILLRHRESAPAMFWRRRFAAFASGRSSRRGCFSSPASGFGTRTPCSRTPPASRPIAPGWRGSCRSRTIRKVEPFSWMLPMMSMPMMSIASWTDIGRGFNGARYEELSAAEASARATIANETKSWPYNDGHDDDARPKTRGILPNQSQDPNVN